MTVGDQVFVDAEGAVKAWLRGHATVGTLVNSRVFLGVNSHVAALPQITVLAFGGGVDVSEAPIDLPRVQIDCWAATRIQAAELAIEVLGAVRSLVGRTPMGGDAVGMGARVISRPSYRTSEEDEEAGRYRYVLDVEFALRAV